MLKYERMVCDHWLYVEKTLAAYGITEQDLCIARHHYISAMTHGYKHACEDLLAQYPEDKWKINNLLTQEEEQPTETN